MSERTYLARKESALTVLVRNIEQVSAGTVAGINCSIHHASICNKNKRKGENLGSSMMRTNVSKVVMYLVKIVIMNGIKSRVFLDTGSDNGYVSLTVINQIRISQKIVQRSIEMLVNTSNRRIKVFELTLKSVDGKLKTLT